MDRPCFIPIPWTNVLIEGGFWGPRLRANHEVTLRHILAQLRRTGRLANLARAAGRLDGAFEGICFNDSDIYKWMEAAAYALAAQGDPGLERDLDEATEVVLAAQRPDGYLNSYFQLNEHSKRWTNLRDMHEMYCAGHLIEAAAAHHASTGRRDLLEAARRFADHIAASFGPGPDQRRGYPGHEELELALVKLYRASGERRYLRQSAFFVDERGLLPHYFQSEQEARGESGRPARFGLEYYQAHAPVREQTEAAGHAVRAMYLYSAMADLAAACNDVSLYEACDRLWGDVVAKKMYITGSIGPAAGNEGFTSAYDLPNETAYAETCAAIGLVFLSHRLLMLVSDARYGDIMERALYNGVLSGVSLDGRRFFYVNPLASRGMHHRREWFDCACCPPNIARLLASLGGYIYAQRPHELAVHLYVQSRAKAEPAGVPVTIGQSTGYPWNGSVELEVEPVAETEFTLLMRVPGWCRRYELRVNGVACDAPFVRGYLRLRRLWQARDRINLELEMPVEEMEAHPAVAQDLGLTALQRGPLVYCLEGVDHEAGLDLIRLPRGKVPAPRFDGDLLGGVVCLEGEALSIDPSSWGHDLYRPASEPVLAPAAVRAVPYYAWDNRAPGGMAVWIPRAERGF